MSAYYSIYAAGSLRLTIGLAPAFLHRFLGVDLGERFHTNIAIRAKTLMEIDRLVYDRLGDIGIGFGEPFPRATIEPYGHRFMPAMFGCTCDYPEDGEPWAEARVLDEAEIETWLPWNLERFESSEPVRRVREQMMYVREHYASTAVTSEAGRQHWNPHFAPMSCMQNLGSVINTGVSVYGQDLLALYLERPEILKRLYRNITDIMLLSLGYFPKLDLVPLPGVFVGNCTVSMISSSSYAAVNLPFDLELADYANANGLPFLVHQDSGATPYLEAYGALGDVDTFDVGLDTDFEALHRLFPGSSVICIILPSWIQDSSLELIEDTLLRVLKEGRKFRNFAFALYDVGPDMGEDGIRRFIEVFSRCAETADREVR